MSFTKTELLEAIALHWGGADNHLVVRPHREATFVGDEGYGRYVIAFPSTQTTLREDDGRPFSHTVPAGRLLVNCLTDAPDNWFYIGIADSLAAGRPLRCSDIDSHGPGCDGPMNCTCSA